MSYTKLFSSILDSTVWQLPLATKVVWITMLAMRDRDGVVEASVPGLAIRAGVDRSECERALAILMAPDPDSRTTEAEGRRIEKVPGGWRLINHDLYAAKLSDEDRKEKDAARQRRRRAKLADLSRSVTGGVTSHGASEEIQPVAHVTTSEQQVEQQEQGEQSPSPVHKPGSARRWTALASQARTAVEAACRARGVGLPIQCSEPDHRHWIDLAKWAEGVERIRADGDKLSAEDALGFAVTQWLESDAPKAGYSPHWFSENPNKYFMAEAIEARAKRKGEAA